MALDLAAHILYVIDGRTEITAADRDLLKLLRQLNKPLALVGKQDRRTVTRKPRSRILFAGIGELFPVSAEHRLGLDELLEHVTAPSHENPRLKKRGARRR